MNGFWNVVVMTTDGTITREPFDTLGDAWNARCHEVGKPDSVFVGIGRTWFNVYDQAWVRPGYLFQYPSVN